MLGIVPRVAASSLVFNPAAGLRAMQSAPFPRTDDGSVWLWANYLSFVILARSRYRDLIAGGLSFRESSINGCDGNVRKRAVNRL
jgi:hypothetical protein